MVTHKKSTKKLLACGAKNLSDTELLAIFTHNQSKEKTPIDLAYRLLKNFGGIRNLFDATEKQLCNTKGLGKTTYAVLQAILEISRRYLAEQLVNTSVISNAQIAYSYLTAKLRCRTRETFACLFLNNQNQLIHYEELFYGTINNLAVYPREIVKAALQHNAAAIIFAHNHPAGNATPSPQDKHLTRVLTKILRHLDIRVLDHIIIGNDSYVSLTDSQ